MKNNIKELIELNVNIKNLEVQRKKLNEMMEYYGISYLDYQDIDNAMTKLTHRKYKILDTWTCPICAKAIPQEHKQEHITMETKELKDALSVLKEV